jgi:hypothetical protein
MATSVLDPVGLDAFWRDGFVRVPGAFSTEAAAAMRDVVWRELESRGLRRDDPTTWRAETQDHLQHLKDDPAFRAIGTDRTLGAIRELIGGAWPNGPSDWGAFFLLFPSGRAWSVPSKAWHIDHTWTDPIEPLRELKVHSLFGDVEPRAGGMTIVAGSHHVVAQVLRDDPPPAGMKAAAIRSRVMRSTGYLRELGTDVGDDDPEVRSRRIERFVDADEDVLGHRLRVVELTGRAGDVILIHPLVLHTRPINAGTEPRFLLNKDLYAPADR